MGPHECSANGLRRLHAEILADLAAVKRVAEKASALLEGRASAPGEAECMGFAASLHHFYTGVEGILERIALAIPRVGSAVLRDQTLREIEPYLSFRDFFRHAYAVEPDWSKIEPLVRALPSVFFLFEQDLHRFTEHLTRSARGIENG